MPFGNCRVVISFLCLVDCSLLQIFFVPLKGGRNAKDLISKNWQILLFKCSITYLFGVISLWNCIDTDQLVLVSFSGKLQPNKKLYQEVATHDC